MATKRYVVREGFIYRTVDAKGSEKVYSEGDIITLEQEVGDAAHQLEYAEDKDRAAALKAEEARSRALKVELPAAAATASVALDHEALATAIAQGIAAAFQAQEAAASADASAGGSDDASKAS
ncbi:hypothetical protein [Herbaspirillum rubrisubalbicans]|uniref:hypothetical protein n=1 Tax=Herbaspirillum rubrisubalbicans TaxID=80842 RepID=UPI0015C5280A|nr:hypothetical protein [Herbaspirillum rubrisubalbicans]NQE47986.1 hypothetical protein [Herbaspirillum rubrisubalbicans]